MPITAKDNAPQFEPVPTGVYPARCFSVIDQGTQQRQWQGEIKARHEVRLGFELLGEEVRDDGKPYTMYKTFTLSLAENSALRPFLENWRGKKFTAEELDGFDLSNLVGAYCQLNVIHDEKDGRTFANIGAIMPFAKGLDKPKAVNPNIVFMFDPWEQEVFDNLHEKVRETIEAAYEYQARFGTQREDKINNVTASDADDPAEVIDIGEEPINLDDIPF